MIADVRDRERVREVINQFRPDVVFHAAALKHVPYLEANWTEGIKTNVFGSVNVADAAVEAGTAAIVMISTDKAIDPVSMLGATKRFAEMYGQALDAEFMGRNRSTRLIAVRFGNVLGSVGSVVPKFKAQIARGGPVTVTHPDMVRYFMTTREAADLVLTSASHADKEGRVLHDGANQDERASVYVLKMGQPVRILELAERMIRLAGFEPGEEIEIAVTGSRPGERLHEILFARGGAAGRDRDRRHHGRKAGLRRPPARRRLARGAGPGGRRQRPRRGRARLRGSDPGIQPAGEESRASRASASRVELTGCQPSLVSASGIRHQRARQAIEGLRLSRHHGAEAQQGGRHRDQAGPPPEARAHRGDDFRAPSAVPDRRRSGAGASGPGARQHRVERPPSGFRGRAGSAARGRAAEGQRPAASGRGPASAAMLPFTPGP